ncbi:MAG: Putative amidohydrolase [Thermoanaerobacterales bacterium 50_218]|nr:MAG: Putative amidohydrolase [Thermoanaerobacterales bacterium 50_218]HAA90007.1 amidohydrolase [Peptococcaceae bacterium]
MLALKNGKVLTMAGSVYEKGTVIIQKGKIAAVGPDLTPPPEAQVIDVSGKYVMPGFIDAHTHIGIKEEIYRVEGDDLNEISDPVTPHLRAIDAIYPEDEGFKDALRGGITTVMTGPGSANVIGGQSLAMKTHTRIVDKSVIKNPVGIKVALGENPKRVYKEQKKAPMTRMATAALLREALVAAQEYMKRLKQGNNDPSKRPDRNLKLEALIPVLRREIPLMIHAHRADDILTGLRIAREFGVRVVLQHATEAHKIAEDLAEQAVPAVVGPSLTNRAKVELKERTFATPGILARAGVKVALMTDHPVVPVQYLPVTAALAVREGMDEEEALKAITINPAEILGIADRVGSLEPGKDADIVVLSGHPLDWRTKVELVIVNGEIAYQAGEEQ